MLQQRFTPEKEALEVLTCYIKSKATKSSLIGEPELGIEHGLEAVADVSQLRPVLGRPLALLLEELVGVDGGAAAPRVQRLSHRGEESLARDLAARGGTVLLQEVGNRLREGETNFDDVINCVICILFGTGMLKRLAPGCAQRKQKEKR